jgi:hypothetical protein
MNARERTLAARARLIHRRTRASLARRDELALVASPPGSTIVFLVPQVHMGRAGNVGVLAACGGVRTPDHFPLARLVTESVSDVELHWEDASAISTCLPRCHATCTSPTLPGSAKQSRDRG